MLAWFGILKKKLTIIVSEAAATQAEKQPVPTNKDDFLNWSRLGGEWKFPSFVMTTQRWAPQGALEIQMFVCLSVILSVCHSVRIMLSKRVPKSS